MALSGDLRNISFDQITCGSLLKQLQEIWDEVGEGDEERDRMLTELDQDCLNVYQRKVDQASRSRAHLLQSLADFTVELGDLISALGENAASWKTQSSGSTIKEQLEAIMPAVEMLRKLKEERLKEFVDVWSQIQTVSEEIAGSSKRNAQESSLIFDKQDLSLRKLSKFQSQLKDLEEEKSVRLQKVMNFVSVIQDLASILGLDDVITLNKVHASLTDSVGMESKSISSETLSKLARTVLSLKEDKKQRLEKLQESAAQLVELWNLIDTPIDERRPFDHITCNLKSTVDDVNAPGSLSLDLLEQVEAEVKRLDQLKFSKMKEISMKKQAELEEIYSQAHIEIDSVAVQEKIFAIIESRDVEPSELMADLDNQILKAREEALTRKEILERVDKWLLTCEEESWLEDYNRDENRYNAGRGAHLNLKRAEKARLLVNRIPVLVEALMAKTRAWEEEHGVAFDYDGAPLLAMLEEYLLLRHEREEEKRRMRDHKKISEVQNNGQEALFGSKPSPRKSTVTKKAAAGARANGSGTTGRRASGNGGAAKSGAQDGKKDTTQLSSPMDHVAISNEDAAAVVSL